MIRCCSWRDQGLTMHVAVNMSATTLKRLDLPDKVGDLVRKYDPDPSQFILDATETALMQELTKSLDTLIRRSMKGFHLCEDIFAWFFQDS